MVNKGLFAYAVGISAALVFVMITGMASRNQDLDEISVHRINVLEADGTIRMVISGQDGEPGFYAMNEYYPREGRPAGLYFMNDEGTEVGGLIYQGEMREDGRPFSMVHFSMDNYNQDQALVLRHIQDQGIVTGMIINDVPATAYDYEALEALTNAEGEERSRIREEIRETGVWDSRMRMFVGRGRSGDAMLSFHDAEGNHRLVIGVSEDGEVMFDVYDADGNITRNVLEDE